jgi:hypothetical protein
MPTSPRIVPVLLAAVVLVGGANAAAYAANGKPLLLGSSNTETKPAVVKNTGSGPALSLQSKAGSPSLAVSSKKKVTRLNADLLDGVDSAALQSKVYAFTLPTSASGVTDYHASVTGMPAGRYLVSYNVLGVIDTLGAHIGCQLTALTGAAAPEMLAVGGTYGGFLASTTLSGVVDAPAEGYTLACFAETGTFGIQGDVSQISFQRLDTVVDDAAAATPPGPKGQGFTGR